MVKVDAAFKVYDFNDDDLICREDLRKVVEAICGEKRVWSEGHLERIIDKFFKEADMDDDNELNYSEFENVIEKAPDFVQSFQFRI